MKVDAFLNERDVRYEYVEQERETHSAYESARERGLSERQVVKSVIMSTQRGFVHCLVPGDREIDEAFFDDAMMADHERVVELTGFEPGSVHPFSSSCRRVVDERVLKCDRVSFTTGGSAEGIIMTVESFREVLDEFEVAVADCTVSQAPGIDRLEREYGLERGVASSLVDEGHDSMFEDLAERCPVEVAADALLFLSRYCEGREVSMDMLSLDDFVSVVDAEIDEQARRRLVAVLEGEDDDDVSLEVVVDAVLEDNAGAVGDFRAGEEGAVNFLVGQVMQETGGRVDPREARERIVESIKDA